jgi:uncharacterized protein YeaO (DUF488 family)
MAHALLIKRAYAPAEAGDGLRVLVDRLWPRGIRKDALKLDLWAREVTPSTEIRKAFGHMAENFEGFRSAYLLELAGNPAAPEFAGMVEKTLKDKPVTLVYAAKSETINHALVLKEWLEGQMAPDKNK